MLKLSQVHDMPKTCRLASGMLLNVVTGYYEMRSQQHRFSSTVLGLKFAVDETNGLQKLHEFMTRYVDDRLIKLMTTQDGSLLQVLR